MKNNLQYATKCHYKAESGPIPAKKRVRRRPSPFEILAHEWEHEDAMRRVRAMWSSHSHITISYTQATIYPSLVTIGGF